LVAWIGLFVIFTWTIDPYGVSPLRFSLPGINAVKPKRIDIDRLIKPYEVWRYQPRTVFLGTSRIHQAINPAILDGSRFAPTYNAAIPGAPMDMNAAHLKQYVGLDRNLRTVIVELFLPNIVAGSIKPESTVWFEFMGNTATLFASASTLWDSVATLAYNALSGRAISQIEPSGYLYHPNRGAPLTSFESFASYIWSSQVHEPDKATFDQSAFDSVRAIIDIARANNLELIFVVTPSHIYADYYYDVIGAWDTFEQWLMKLSQRTTVYSFSQHHASGRHLRIARPSRENRPLEPVMEQGREQNDGRHVWHEVPQLIVLRQVACKHVQDDEMEQIDRVGDVTQIGRNGSFPRRLQ